MIRWRVLNSNEQKGSNEEPSIEGAVRINVNGRSQWAVLETPQPASKYDGKNFTWQPIEVEQP